MLNAQMLTSQAWRFERAPGHLISPQLRFLDGGRLGFHAHPNEASWSLVDGTLRLHDLAGRVTTAFNRVTYDGGLVIGGNFVPDPATVHELRAVPRLERLPTREEAVAVHDRGTACRRHLVVLRANAASLHTSWARDVAAADRNWDLCISWYGADSTLDTDPDADWESLQAADRKFPALWKLFGENSPLWRYDHVMFPDDDLQMSWRDINRCFEVVREHDLLLAQPAMAPAGYVNHDITRQRPECRLRLTDFVEVMCPIFSRAALAACAPTFGMSRLGFGIDHVWPKLLGHRSLRMGIIDEVAITHTRPMATNYDIRPVIEEGTRIVRSFGAWESYRELGRLYRS